MLTEANYLANLRTAAKNAAAAAGLDPAKRTEWTVEQRADYNRRLIRQILDYPGSFAPAVVTAAVNANTDYGLRGHTFDSAFDVGIGAALDGAKSYVNKLLIVIAIGAALYFAVIAGLTRPRRA